MAITDATLKAYVKHALQLIRVSNGLSASATQSMRGLGVAIRRLLAGADLQNMTLRNLRSLLSQVDQLVVDHLDDIAQTQNAATAELVAAEAEWSRTVSALDYGATDAAIARTISQFTVFGNTLEEHFGTVAERLSNQIRAQIRQGIVAGQSDNDIIKRIIGPGRDMRGGILDGAKRDVRNVVDGATLGAADAGRRATMAASGVNAIQWSAKLDEKLCPNCGARDGKIWLIDGTPVGHEIPWMPAPLHPRCRCITPPLDIPADALADVEQNPSDSFDKWLTGLDPSEQEDILGKGRAELWRNGDITTSDLINQNGQVSTLSSLRGDEE
jgi:SPP1 gp7 family putative phage head morphogenesis protein